MAVPGRESAALAAPATAAVTCSGEPLVEGMFGGTVRRVERGGGECCAVAGYRPVVTIEDNAASGGFGDAFARSLRASGQPTAQLTLALSNGFAPVCDRAGVHRQHGLEADGITRKVEAEYARLTERRRTTGAPGPGLGLRRGGIEPKWRRQRPCRPLDRIENRCTRADPVDGEVIALRKVALQR